MMHDARFFAVTCRLASTTFLLHVVMRSFVANADIGIHRRMCEGLNVYFVFVWWVTHSPFSICFFYLDNIQQKKEKERADVCTDVLSYRI